MDCQKGDADNTVRGLEYVGFIALFLYKIFGLFFCPAPVFHSNTLCTALLLYQFLYFRAGDGCF